GLGLSAAGVVRGRGAVRGARAAAEEGSWPGGPCSRVPAPAAANAAMRTAPTHPEGSGSWKTIMPARIGSAFVSSVESPAGVRALPRWNAAWRAAVPAGEKATRDAGEAMFAAPPETAIVVGTAPRGKRMPDATPQAAATPTARPRSVTQRAAAPAEAPSQTAIQT